MGKTLLSNFHALKNTEKSSFSIFFNNTVFGLSLLILGKYLIDLDNSRHRKLKKPEFSTLRKGNKSCFSCTLYAASAFQRLSTE